MATAETPTPDATPGVRAPAENRTGTMLAAPSPTRPKPSGADERPGRGEGDAEAEDAEQAAADGDRLRPEPDDDRVAEQAEAGHREGVGGVAEGGRLRGRRLGAGEEEGAPVGDRAFDREAEEGEDAEAEHGAAREGEARRAVDRLLAREQVARGHRAEGEEDDADRHRAGAVAPAVGDDRARRPAPRQGRRSSRSHGRTTWSACRGASRPRPPGRCRRHRGRPSGRPKKKSATKKSGTLPARIGSGIVAM